MLTATEHVQPESCAASHITDGAGQVLKRAQLVHFLMHFNVGKS